MIYYNISLLLSFLHSALCVDGLIPRPCLPLVTMNAFPRACPFDPTT